MYDQKSYLIQDFCDRVQLIRRVQRSQGKEDCFGRKYGRCKQMYSCPWGKYCSQFGALISEGAGKKDIPAIESNPALDDNRKTV